MKVWVQVEVCMGGGGGPCFGPRKGPCVWGSVVPVASGAGETGVVPIRMKRAHICLSEKNPD